MTDIHFVTHVPFPSGVSHCFEGPEKRLEIDFKPNPDVPFGLRHVSKEQWQDMLDLAKCTIISQTSNDHFDSFVLSESSLFVYPTKVMLKTCGTTTLLRCIPRLLHYASNLDLEVDYVVFSRKNFLFPQEQQFPHNSWNNEVAYLNEFFDGHAYIYGPLNTEHWFLYVADYSQGEEAAARSEFTLEIMMHRMDPSATPQFFRTEEKGDKDKMPGIADLLPGSETDEFNFTPCGYSMNGLKDEAYWTIHVTPEDHCSYASFETNVRLFSAAKLNALVQRVIGVFKPGVMTVSLFTSNKDNARPALELPGYMSRHRTVTEMESCGAVTVWNFETHEIAAERNNGALMRKRSWRAAYNARRAGKQSDSDEEANRDESFDFRRNIMSPSSDVSSRMSEEEREENRHSPRIAGIADHDNSDNSDGELSGN